MKVSYKRVFNHRKFISLSLVLNLAVLVVTAIVIQVFEALENDFFLHLFNVTHIFAGLVFTVLSVLHLMMNWQFMKVYIKTKGLMASREAHYAFLLTMTAILTAVLFILYVKD